VAVAVMRNRFGGGLDAVSAIDRTVAGALPSSTRSRPDRSDHE
jgi:hypothetical protein